MSEKMECPGCGAWTSSTLDAYLDGDPCPTCGLSAAASREIISTRNKLGETELVERLTELSKQVSTQEAELRSWRRVGRDLRRLVGELPSGE